MDARFYLHLIIKEFWYHFAILCVAIIYLVAFRELI